MEWTAQQEQALAGVSRWLGAGDAPLYRLFGYAGTGKTTLARHLAQDMKVIYAAYTGKAALVMQKAGCTDAQTIHSLIYQPYEESDARARIEALNQALAEEPDEDQRAHMRKELAELEDSVRSPYKPKPSFILRAASDLADADLLVLDECSMVNEEMARDLMSFGTPILVLGDPAQLPPIRGEGFFISERPDTMLTDVMRQAKDNPIIRIATMVREGRTVPTGNYGESRVIEGRPEGDEALSFDQIIVGMNKTRSLFNRWIRNRKGFTDPMPVVGDRVICLRNDKKAGFLNGGMWAVEGASEARGEHFVIMKNIKSDDSPRVVDRVVAHRHILGGYQREMTPWEWRDAQEFDYAYAITCHKSQGSQWGSVALFDEWFNSDTRQRWLYTAVTRAQERLTIYRR